MTILLYHKIQIFFNYNKILNRLKKLIPLTYKTFPFSRSLLFFFKHFKKYSEIFTF